MYVTVLTTSKVKVFETFHRDAGRIDEEVKQKYGTQPSGLPHNWIGDTSARGIRRERARQQMKRGVS